MFGPSPTAIRWWPAWLPWSPAFLILWAPGGFPPDLLLLPGRLLQGVLGRPTGLRRRRAAQELPRRELVALILQNVHRYFLYVAIVFISSSPRRLEGRCGSVPPGGRDEFGIGVGTLVLTLNVILLGGYTFGCHSLRHLVGGDLDSSLASPARTKAWSCVSCLNKRHHMWAWFSLFWVGFTDVYVRLCSMGVWTDWRISDEIESIQKRTHEHDVLVIGAGGAGLRAAIEAARTASRVGLVCKSLLGKAHTVMAEGGMAASLANVDDRDDWQTHFADTMRGGQYVNNWRMAELHAQEAPDRVRELEAWGAVFDRTKDGKILQRNFGGHKLPASRPRRRPHRPRDDPHATGPRHPPGHRRHMECTVFELLKDGDRVVGAFWPTTASAAASACSRPRRSCSPPAASAARSRSRATAGSTPATATRWRTGPAPS